MNLNIRENTRKDYENRIKYYIEPFFNGVKVRSIDFEMVEAFRTYLLENNVGKRTINKCLITLGAMLKSAIKRGWIKYNPVRDVDKIKEGTEEKEGVEDEGILRPYEIQELLKQFKPSEEIWKLVIKSAILTGLRQGELLGLSWSEVDFNSNQIFVRRTYSSGNFTLPKTPSSRRKVDVPSVLMKELKVWKLKCPSGKHNLVFPNGAGNPENHGNLLRRGFYPALKRAGLRHIRFHDLRHTFASLLIENGEHPKYIQKQLGHKSIKTTMDVYGHLMEGVNTESADKLAGLALGFKDEKIKSGDKLATNYQKGSFSAKENGLTPRNNLVPRGGIEPSTQGFSGLCSTD